MSYLSPVRYGFAGLMSCQFPVYHEDGTVYDETEYVMEEYGFENANYWYSVLALTIHFIFFRCMVVVSLWLQDASKTKGMTDNRN